MMPRNAGRIYDDILIVCDIDPPHHNTCIGVTRSGASCKRKVSKKSRESASHQLNSLALCGPGDSLEIELKHVAGLLLCKRQHQAQASSMGQYWYNSLVTSCRLTRWASTQASG
ncbi:hypothetical protein BJX63DRAFT_132880 [Aspergillus granulosus]|uniref:Uncharacterized protein n=1 Tax=Aspergillus granulosus TaxID=176169 RepID=A0ABR4GT04_9EURO